MSPVGRMTSRAHSEVRSIWGSSVSDALVRFARSRVAGGEVAREAAQLAAGTSGSRACSIHGNDASMVEGVSRTPGRMSRAKARVGGKAG